MPQSYKMVDEMYLHEKWSCGKKILREGILLQERLG